MSKPIEARLPDGRVFRFPAGTSEEIVQQTVRRELNIQPEASPAEPASQEDPSNFLRKGFDLGMEAIAGFNRPLAGMADLTVPGTPFSDRVGPKGYWGGEGLASRTAGTGGEFAGFGVPVAASARAMTRLYNSRALLGEGGSMATKFFELMGQGSTADDMLLNFLSGSAGELTAEKAAELFGEDMREYGELFGQVGAPVGAALAAPLRPAVIGNTLNKVYQATKNWVTGKNAPSRAAIKGAADFQFNLLREAGITANGPGVDLFNNRMAGFMDAEGIAKSAKGPINTKINNLLKDADNGKLTYSVLIDAASELRSSFKNDPNLSRVAMDLADELDRYLVDMPVDEAVLKQLGGETPSQVLTHAKRLYQMERTAAVIDDAFSVAEEKARGQTGGDFIDLFEKEIKRITNPKTRNSTQGRYMSERQINQLRSLVDGGLARNGLRGFEKTVGVASKDYLRTIMYGMLAGSVVGQQAGNMAAGAAAGGGVVGGVAVLGTGLAHLAKRMADGIYKRDANLAQRAFRADSAQELMNAYRTRVPTEKRNVFELASMLHERGLKVSHLKNMKSVQDSTFLSQVVNIATIINAEVMEDVPSVPESMR